MQFYINISLKRNRKSRVCAGDFSLWPDCYVAADGFEPVDPVMATPLLSICICSPDVWSPAGRYHKSRFKRQGGPCGLKSDVSGHLLHLQVQERCARSLIRLKHTKVADLVMSALDHIDISLGRTILCSAPPCPHPCCVLEDLLFLDFQVFTANSGAPAPTWPFDK